MVFQIFKTFSHIIVVAGCNGMEMWLPSDADIWLCGASYSGAWYSGAWNSGDQIIVGLSHTTSDTASQGSELRKVKFFPCKKTRQDITSLLHCQKQRLPSGTFCPPVKHFAN